MSGKASNLVVMVLFSGAVLFGQGLSKQDQEKLMKTFAKGQTMFLIHPYLEGDTKGLHIYKIREGATPEFEPSWRDVINPELRLLRGDKVVCVFRSCCPASPGMLSTLRSEATLVLKIVVQVDNINQKTIDATSSRFLSKPAT